MYVLTQVHHTYQVFVPCPAFSLGPLRSEAVMSQQEQREKSSSLAVCFEPERRAIPVYVTKCGGERGIHGCPFGFKLKVKGGPSMKVTHPWCVLGAVHQGERGTFRFVFELLEAGGAAGDYVPVEQEFVRGIRTHFGRSGDLEEPFKFVNSQGSVFILNCQLHGKHAV